MWRGARAQHNVVVIDARFAITHTHTHTHTHPDVAAVQVLSDDVSGSVYALHGHGSRHDSRRTKSPAKRRGQHGWYEGRRLKRVCVMGSNKIEMTSSAIESEKQYAAISVWSPA
jgi:hypothetical protein